MEIASGLTRRVAAAVFAPRADDILARPGPWLGLLLEDQRMFCSRSALPFGVPFEVPARRGSGSADVILGARGTNGRPPHCPLFASRARVDGAGRLGIVHRSVSASHDLVGVLRVQERGLGGGEGCARHPVHGALRHRAIGKTAVPPLRLSLRCGFPTSNSGRSSRRPTNPAEAWGPTPLRRPRPPTPQPAAGLPGCRGRAPTPAPPSSRRRPAPAG